MTLSEKDFLLELESDKNTLKSLFSKAGQYDCPCRRKNMTNADWKKYKNGYMQKVWKLLHERSFKYLNNPSNDAQEKVFNFYNTDVKRIPCYVCRKHYTEFLSKNNLKGACTSRDKLCKFLIDLHNDVNKDTKKSIMSYQDVYKLYGYHYNIYSYPIVKTEPFVKQEPPKLKTIEKKSVKLEPINKAVSESQKRYLLELNKKLTSKQTFIRNIPNTRNNIVKQGMMSTINRGIKYK